MEIRLLPISNFPHYNFSSPTSPVVSPSSSVLHSTPPQTPAIGSTMTSTAMAATLHQHQWSEEETREFIRIRADLEKDLTAVSTGEAPAAKKKTLWEMASVRMREKGFWRTADQCKCKWKNLLSRYKVGPLSNPVLIKNFLNL